MNETANDDKWWPPKTDQRIVAKAFDHNNNSSSMSLTPAAMCAPGLKVLKFSKSVKRLKAGLVRTVATFVQLKRYAIVQRHESHRQNHNWRSQLLYQTILPCRVYGIFQGSRKTVVVFLYDEDIAI